MTDGELILKDIANQLHRIADAYETMVGHVVGNGAKKSAAPTSSPQTTPPAASTSRQKKNPADCLTTIAPILNFNLLDKTTKKGNPMWKLELVNGFSAHIFSASQAETCNVAADNGAPLVVSYTVDGKYSNVEAVEIGRGGQQATPTAAARPKSQTTESIDDTGDPF